MSTSPITHLSEAVLLAGLDHIRDAPKTDGVLEMIVVRPQENERISVHECLVSAAGGVVGDRWAEKRRKLTADGLPDPGNQVTLMNSRCIALLAQEKSRWPLAGDQLYVDLDLSDENLPVGQRLAIGTAVLEITSLPHTGCSKFSSRFGPDALAFVNSETGKQLHLRGIYAQVVQDGRLRVGDRVVKIRA